MPATNDPTGDLHFRQTEPEDRRAIIELCRQALGWQADDPNEAFFTWKHDENPFGQSPAWVAEDDEGTLVGLRTFLRWRFRRPDGTTIKAVRAVDTATHPDWQGRGIFSRLTLSALDDLQDEGVDCVFNTPNDKSRLGYLKMGWQQVGKFPVSVRLTGQGSIASWPAPAPPPRSGRRSRRSGNRPVRCSPITAPSKCSWPESAPGRTSPLTGPRSFSTGVTGSTRCATGRSAWERASRTAVVFRARRRGTAVEATICDVLAPRRAHRSGLKALKGAGVDYLLKGSTPQGRRPLADARQGFVPVPALGPILTWRPVAIPMVPTMDQLALSLGDIELF
ncbi:MAG: GNAT family N-acetyltransferase [Microthrixaceae bacterium]